MEELRRLRLSQRKAVADRRTAVMEAAATRLVSDERSSAWAEELQQLAVEVSALPPAAQRAIRTVLDAIACEDACEVEHAEQLRKQIAALDHTSDRSKKASASAAPSPRPPATRRSSTWTSGIGQGKPLKRRF